MDTEEQAEDTPILRLEEAESKAEAEEKAAQRVAKRRGRWHVALACIGVVGILAASRFMRAHPKATGEPCTAEALAGTWELASVNGDPVGPNVESVVVDQRVTFSNGKVQGETHLRGDVPATATALPFPDDSVSRVTTGTNGTDITVTWTGTYALETNGRLMLRVGKATYFAFGTWNAPKHTLTFDHDVILTYPGAASYRLPAHSEQVSSL